MPKKEIAKGFTFDELVIVRKKIYRIKTFCTEETLKKLFLLQCIQEFLEDSELGGIKNEEVQK